MPFDIDAAMRGGVGADPNPSDTHLYTSIHSVNIYDFMDHAFNGTCGFRDGTYLVPHSREMFYTKRREISFYKNFVKSIIRAMVEPIFTELVSRPVMREGGETEVTDLFFNRFIEDCDNAGTHLQAFTEKVVRLARLHGVTYVVVENFPNSEMPASVPAALKERKFPYVYSKTAQEVEDFEVDKFGNLNRITFEDLPVEVMKGKKKEKQPRWRRWTENDSQLMKKNKEGKLVPDGPPLIHNLGKVPVISLYSIERENLQVINVDPPLYDLARLNHAIFNKDSEIRSQERSQGFSIFYVQTNQTGNLTIGDQNILFIPEGATMAPGFASPNPAILTGLQKGQVDLREDLFRIAEQNGVTGVQAGKSGVAIQWDFFAHESVLKKSSSLAIKCEQEIAGLFKLYTKEKFDYAPSYPDDFQPNDKMAEIKL